MRGTWQRGEWREGARQVSASRGWGWLEARVGASMVAGGLSPAFNPLLLCPTLTIPLLRPVPRRRHNQYKKDEKRGEGTCLGEWREGMVRVHDLSAQGLRRPEPAEGRQCFRTLYENRASDAKLAGAGGISGLEPKGKEGDGFRSGFSLFCPLSGDGMRHAHIRRLTKQGGGRGP